MAEKKKRKASGAAATSGGVRAAKERPAGFLRTRSDTRSELRFLPHNGPAAAISVLAMSLGALAVGAGVYGKFLRDAAAGSHPWSTWLLVGGAALFAAAALLGAMPASPARVGDAGVALEKGDLVEHLPWHSIDSVSVAGKALVVRGVGRSVTFPLAAHPDAAARIASEAQTRLPGKVGDLAGLQPGEGSGGEKIALEPLQLAGMRCAASDRIIALDKDGRVCGRCGQVYHRESVPPACVSCDAPLA
jgi:hypothetical protein